MRRLQMLKRNSKA